MYSILPPLPSFIDGGHQFAKNQLSKTSTVGNDNTNSMTGANSSRTSGLNKSTLSANVNGLEEVAIKMENID